MKNREVISSRSNPQIRKIRELQTRAKVRREEGVFLAEGPRMVRETPKDRLVRLYVSESFAEDAGAVDLEDAVLVKDSVFSVISQTIHPQGVLAVVRQDIREEEELLDSQMPLLVILECIQDPGNLGTIIRTAECAGASGVIMSRDCADLYNPKTIRATMGSVYRMPAAISPDIVGSVNKARERGIRVFAAHLQGSRSLYDADFTGPSAVLIGNEGNGLSTEAAKAADEAVRIPMAGKADSLNASVATSIILYEAARQRMMRRERV